MGTRWATIVPRDLFICCYAACVQRGIPSRNKTGKTACECELDRRERHSTEILLVLQSSNCGITSGYVYMDEKMCADRVTNIVTKFILLCSSCAWSALLARMNAFPASNKNEFVPGPMVLWIVIEYIYLNSGVNTGTRKKYALYTTNREKLTFRTPWAGLLRAPETPCPVLQFFQDLFKTPIYVYIKIIIAGFVFSYRLHV